MPHIPQDRPLLFSVFTFNSPPYAFYPVPSQCPVLRVNGKRHMSGLFPLAESLPARLDAAPHIYRRLSAVLGDNSLDQGHRHPVVSRL